MKFLADENFNGHVVHALLGRLPAGSLIRAQDVGLSGADDASVLEWAASNQCIVLTHDVATFSDFAYARVEASLPMPGVFEVSQRQPLREIVEEIILIAACSAGEEWKDRVVYLPL
ncbi:MAG TPA: DUF5615 family PIN-like protein [Tepidisphaeraceae bacterium]|nr:DUF5615 family PIN-like protein [Tepidisphaeraceae bacterium]